jgi:hypothetical protein
MWRVQLLVFLAQEIEAFERHLVGDNEQIGIASFCGMASQCPMWDREHIVL